MKYVKSKIGHKADKFNPLAQLILDGNLSERWTTWKGEFQFYLTARESKTKQAKLKHQDYCLQLVQSQGNFFYTFNLTDDEESMTFDICYSKI